MKTISMGFIGAMLIALAAMPAGLAAQLALPGKVIGDTLNGLPIPNLADLPPVRAATDLALQRLERIDRLVRQSRGSIARDDQGEPALSGVAIVSGADPDAIALAVAEGYAVIGRDNVDALGLDFVRIAVPQRQSLGTALKRLRKLMPNAEVSADNLYLASGQPAPLVVGVALAQRAAAPRTIAIGIIDGGVAAHPALSGPIEQRGFARGGPVPSAHGTAIASLIAGTGSIRGAAPDNPLLVADVYGRDSAGGSASAIAQALGWLVQRRAPVATISLVGPANALLARAISAAQTKGLMIVAAVGNDGPAAPPAYPASYPGVIAVTGVDGRDRALIEAGRALHLDYAAPGADMRAASGKGGTAKMRGTSFAAPLVAARLSVHYRIPDPGQRAAALRALDSEARDLGPKGVDKIYGRGLICGLCRTR